MARRRSTVARHARLHSPSVGGQVLALLAVAVVVILAAGAGTVGYTAFNLASTVGENSVELDVEVQQPPQMGAFEGAFDVLIVGTDECELELASLLGERCTGAEAEGSRNDVNILVHVSDAPRRVTVVSFPRDLQIEVPSCVDESGATSAASSKAPIHSAYDKGGLNCVVNTVSELSGIAIPFAAKASFGNVIAITEAIGGVDVCIGNGGIRDRYTSIDWPAGPRTVRGYDALQFLRTRHGVGDESDLARIGNQQQYLSSLARKLTSDEVLSDPAALLRLATAAVDNITPSESLTNPVRIVQLALAVRDVPTSDIAFVQYPVLTDPADADRVVPDYDAAEALWDALAQNRPLEITGSVGRGVIETTPSPEESAPTTAPEASPAPTETAAELPTNIPGSTADQPTCSAGNLPG